MEIAAREALNLRVLKRYIASIAAIVGSASHVVVYLFDETQQTWTKLGCEGAMFVVARETTSAETPFAVMVMNRLGIENYVADLTPDLDVQLLGDYIVFRTASGDVYGLWAYEADQRQRLAALLSQCAKRSSPRATAAAPAPEDAAAVLRRMVGVQEPPAPAAAPVSAPTLTIARLFDMLDRLPPAVESPPARALVTESEIVGRLVCLCQRDMEFRRTLVTAYHASGVRS